MELVAEYAERTVVMEGGRITLDEPTREVFEYVDVLRSTYIDPPRIVSLAQSLKDIGLPSWLLTVSEVAESLVELKRELIKS